MTNLLVGRDSEKPLDKEREWVDFTQLINETCQKLGSDEMLHSLDFRLQKVMSAVEIMDPKMDTGMNFLNHQVLSVEERLKNNSLQLNLTPLQILEVMDMCLMAESSWYNGYYLTQSVFTCLYIQIIDKLSSKFLQNYLKGFLKCCENVYRIMELSLSKEVKEHEEFFSKTYENQIVFDYDDEEMISESLKFEKELEQREKVSSPKVDSFIPLQDDESLEPFFCLGFLHRLRFRRLFLRICRIFSSERNKVEEQISEIPNLCKEALKNLKFISKDHNSKKIKIKEDEIVGFDYQITRLIHNYLPQKPKKLVPFKKCYKILFNHLTNLSYIKQLYDVHTTLSNYLNFFQLYSCVFPPPNVICRTLLWKLYSCESGENFSLNVLNNKSNYKELLKRNLMVKNNFSEKVLAKLLKNKETTVLIEQISMCYSLFCNYFCHNLPKLRRKLTRLVTDHLSKVIVNCRYIDKKNSDFLNRISVFRPHVTEFLIEVLTTIFLVGFRCDLYSYDEYNYIFCYLDFLSSNMIETLNDRIKDKKFHLKLQKWKVFLLLNRGLNLEILYLFLMGYLKPRKFTFGTEKERFKKRFEFCENVFGTNSFTYSYYIETKRKLLKAEKTKEQILKSVKEHLKASEVILNQILKSEVLKKKIEIEKIFYKNLFKIVKGNQISLSFIERMNEQVKYAERKEKNVIMDFSKGIYPIIKIK